MIDRVSIDNFCDYVPVISTLTNIRDAIAKRHTGLDPLTASDEFSVHLFQKSWGRIIAGCIPVLGNLFLAVSDLAGRLKNETYGVDVVVGNPSKFKSLPPHLRDNKAVALAALGKAEETYDQEHETWELKRADLLAQNNIEDINSEEAESLLKANSLWSFTAVENPSWVAFGILKHGGKAVRHDKEIIERIAKCTSVQTIKRNMCFLDPKMAITFLNERTIQKALLGDRELQSLASEVDGLFRGNVPGANLFRQNLPPTMGGTKRPEGQ